MLTQRFLIYSNSITQSEGENEKIPGFCLGPLGSGPIFLNNASDYFSRDTE